MFCNLIVTDVVYSDLEISGKMKLTREHFRSMFLYDFRPGLPRHVCIDQLTFDDEVPSYATMKRV